MYIYDYIDTNILTYTYMYIYIYVCASISIYPCGCTYFIVTLVDFAAGMLNLLCFLVCLQLQFRIYVCSCACI